MASLKDARAVVEEGRSTNRGQLPEFIRKTDKFGLGFTSGAQRAVRRARARGPPLRIRNRGVNAIEDNDEDSILKAGSTLLPTVDLVIGQRRTSYLFLLFRNN